MPCFVNLPLRWVYNQSAWTGWFINGRIAPEFGLDLVSIDLPDAWHKDLAKRFRDAGLACAVHLPFLGIDPADPDAAKAATARKALRRGAELARIHGAAHMIGHPYYRLDDRNIDGQWLEKSLLAWPALPEIGNAPLFLENTYERSPRPLVALLEGLRRSSGPAAGVCFDLGHWHAFAGKSLEQELDPWLDAFAPYAMHLHLHDNNGSHDEHLGMGGGSVPFEALFARLEARGKKVSATLEPHNVESFAGSIAWLASHRAIAASLGWEAPRMEYLPLDEIEKHLDH